MIEKINLIDISVYFLNFLFYKPPVLFYVIWKSGAGILTRRFLNKRKKATDLLTQSSDVVLSFQEKPGNYFFSLGIPFKDTNCLQRNYHKMYGKILAPNRIDIEETVWLWCYACELLDAFWALGFKYFNISLIDSKYCVCK